MQSGCWDGEMALSACYSLPGDRRRRSRGNESHWGSYRSWLLKRQAPSVGYIFDSLCHSFKEFLQNDTKILILSQSLEL